MMRAEERVRGCVPVFPDRLTAEGPEIGGDHAGVGAVADGKLFKRLRISCIAPRIGLRAGTHGCDAESGHVVAELMLFAG